MTDTLNISQLKAAVDAALEQYAQHDLDREQALLEANQRILAQQTHIADLQDKVDELLKKIEELQAEIGDIPPDPWKPDPSPANISLSGHLIAGSAVHVRALAGPAYPTDPLSCHYEWDFGDPGSDYNMLYGWNAAHVYEKPGQYTIKLKIIDSDKKSHEGTTTVVISPSNSKVLGVGSGGDFQSLDDAMAWLTDDMVIRLERGKVHRVSQQFLIDKKNVTIGAYGEGKNPIIKAVNWKTDNVIFRMAPTASNFVVQGITFDSDQTSHTERTATPVCITASGTGLTVRDCTFLNVDFAVNGNGVPTGVLMQNNSGPLETGIRSCFAWVEGSDWVILGNDVVNVTRQHVVRMQRYNRVLIFGNRLANIDRQDEGDKLDWVKTVFWAMEGQYAYFSNNVTTNGVARIGPFQEGDTNLRTQNVRIEDNDISGNWIEVMAGTVHLLIRDNTIAANDTTAISVAGFSKHFGFGVDDLRIVDNDVENAGKKGKFMAIGAGLSGITLTGNSYAAPSLSTTAPDYSIITVSDDNVKAFARVSGNTWTAKPVRDPKGTFIYVWPLGTDGKAVYNEKGCWTAQQWNEATGGHDTFMDASKAVKP